MGVRLGLVKGYEVRLGRRRVECRLGGWSEGQAGS